MYQFVSVNEYVPMDYSYPPCMIEVDPVPAEGYDSTMQILTIHGVIDVLVQPVESYKGSHWRKVIVQTDEGKTEIVLFPASSDDQVEIHFE